MKVNFVVEDMLFFKYIGCATVAKSLYRHLDGSDQLDVSWDILCTDCCLSHYHTFGPLALMNKKAASGIKVLTAHSTPRINTGNLALSGVINKRYPKIYSAFDHIVTISETCHNEIQDMVPDVPVTLIPNGVNREFFAPDAKKRRKFRELWGIGEDEQMVLTVAQRSPRKGIYDFLELAERFPDTKFVWVGGFPYGPASKDFLKIRQRVNRCADNVIFTGFVDDISTPYCAADVFFMPSYAETFGLVVLEALSSGLPVIARNIPEFREIFGESVLYFDTVEDVAGLLPDESCLRAVGNRARDASACFDIRDIAKKHVDLYQDLVEL